MLLRPPGLWHFVRAALADCSRELSHLVVKTDKPIVQIIRVCPLENLAHVIPTPVRCCDLLPQRKAPEWHLEHTDAGEVCSTDRNPCRPPLVPETILCSSHSREPSFAEEAAFMPLVQGEASGRPQCHCLLQEGPQQTPAVWLSCRAVCFRHSWLCPGAACLNPCPVFLSQFWAYCGWKPSCWPTNRAGL